MKILHLCLSHGKGGLELYAIRILLWLSEKGAPPLAVTSVGSFTSTKLEESNIPYRTLRCQSIYFPFLSALRLACIMNNEKIDILHMHCGKDLALAAMAKIFSRYPVKLIYTRHMGLNRSKRDVYHRLLYHRVDRFLAITKLIYTQAQDNLTLPEERLELLYHGVVAPDKRQAMSKDQFLSTLGVENTNFTILLVGRIDIGKGQELLVEAIQRLRAKGIKVTAVFVGHIMNERYYETLMRDVKEKGLSDQIFCYGHHPKPMEIMGLFDLVVAPTYKEAFGLVLAEAMRCGTAVVGSDAGGIPEIIKDGETGLLFETRNVDALTSALERLILEPDFRKKLAAAGKAFADENFSEERHFARLEEICREVKEDALPKSTSATS